MSPTSLRNGIRKGLAFYRACSLLFLNCFLVFAIVNVAIFVVYRVKNGDGILGRPRPSNHVVGMFGMPALREVYPSYQDDEIRQTDTRDMGSRT